MVQRAWVLKSGEVEFESRLGGALPLGLAAAAGAVASFEEQTRHTLHSMVPHLSGLDFLRGGGVLSFLPQEQVHTASPSQ